MPDIDIDFADRDKALSLIRYIKASREQDSNLTAHNTGIYVTDIPHNPLSNTSNINYKIAEERGYYKIDLLNVNIYKDVQSEAHLLRLMNQEPLWELLEQDDFTNMLFHINGHGNILRIMKPTNIEQLAAILAMIRPAKRHLVGKEWTEVMKEVWTKPSNEEYYFKHAHAIAYAQAIVVQMNLICEGLGYEYS